jgi:hypothetical protein
MPGPTERHAEASFGLSKAGGECNERESNGCFVSGERGVAVRGENSADGIIWATILSSEGRPRRLFGGFPH